MGAGHFYVESNPAMKSGDKGLPVSTRSWLGDLHVITAQKVSNGKNVSTPLHEAHTGFYPGNFAVV